MKNEIIQPDGWPRPKGYANGVLAPEGRLLFVAGQIAWDEREQIVSSDLGAQFLHALDNVLAVVRKAGGQPEHITRFTVFVSDKDEYMRAARAIGEGYRTRMGKHYVAMSLVEVKALLEPGAKVEIEATAVIPGGAV
ncbi:MAG: RidA family protein [Myxococcota bacterium]